MSKTSRLSNSPGRALECVAPYLMCSEAQSRMIPVVRRDSRCLSGDLPEWVCKDGWVGLIMSTQVGVG
jgi:hypothetical protein